MNEKKLKSNCVSEFYLHFKKRTKIIYLKSASEDIQRIRTEIYIVKNFELLQIYIRAFFLLF